MSVNEQLKAISILLKEEKAQEAKKAFLQIDVAESAAYFLLKGKIEQKFQNWGEAINAFNKVLEYDHNNMEAKNNLHLIQNILNFWNPDLLNP